MIRASRFPKLIHRMSHGALFLIISMSLHLALAIIGTMFFWTPWIPQIEVTWLDLDNTLGSPSPLPKSSKSTSDQKQKTKHLKSLHLDKEPKSQVATAGQSMVTEVPTPKPEPAPRNIQKKQPTEPPLNTLAPGDAALMLFLRTDRIRETPYEDAVRHLLEVFYDHKTLLWSRQIDALRDFNALLIATPNPYRVTQTFLVAQHTLPQNQIISALEDSVHVDSKRMKWRHERSSLLGQVPSPPKLLEDHRVILLMDNLVCFTEPQYAKVLMNTFHQTLHAGDEIENHSIEDKKTKEETWIQNLSKINQVGGRNSKGPALMLEAINLPRLLILPSDIPMPQSVTVTAPASRPTPFKGVVRFTNEREARTFIKVIPQKIEALSGSFLLRFLGVAALLKAITLHRKKAEVHAEVFLSESQVIALLEVIRRMIPQVDVPGMPPRLPLDAGPIKPTDAHLPSKDAGSRTAGQDSGI